ncbi:MAG TPA: hypothetical protein VNC78_12055 [Actinomycetota bacterium]|nr:hypothetical protein [Actinomycetota bacterium]
MVQGKKLVILLSLIALLGASACGASDDPAADDGPEAKPSVAEPVAPEVLTATMHDDRVDFVASVEAEPVTVRIDNRSKHKELFLIFARLNEGASKEKVVKQLASGSEKVLELITVAGGVFLEPKAPGEATILFPEGSYLATDPEAKGMEPAFFDVLPATGPPVEEPDSLGTISVGEYFFKAEEPLPGGEGVYKIENVGEQSHEVIVSRGKKEAGFALAPAPGGALWAAIGDSFKPGEYEFVCYFPDADSGKPHIKLGMKATFKVE